MFKYLWGLNKFPFTIVLNIKICHHMTYPGLYTYNNLSDFKQIKSMQVDSWCEPKPTGQHLSSVPLINSDKWLLVSRHNRFIYRHQKRVSPEGHLNLEPSGQNQFCGAQQRQKSLEKKCHDINDRWWASFCLNMTDELTPGDLHDSYSTTYGWREATTHTGINELSHL